MEKLLRTGTNCGHDLLGFHSHWGMSPTIKCFQFSKIKYLMFCQHQSILLQWWIISNQDPMSLHQIFFSLLAYMTLKNSCCSCFFLHWYGIDVAWYSLLIIHESETGTIAATKITHRHPRMTPISWTSQGTLTFQCFLYLTTMRRVKLFKPSFLLYSLKRKTVSLSL